MAMEVRHDEGAGDFARAVATVVVEENGVAGGDAGVSGGVADGEQPRI